MTFGEAAAIHLRNLEDNLSIKPRTRDYWGECLAALKRSWPGLDSTEVRRITQGACKEWARAYAKSASPTRFNNTVAILRHILWSLKEWQFVPKRSPCRLSKNSTHLLPKCETATAATRSIALIWRRVWRSLDAGSEKLGRSPGAILISRPVNSWFGNFQTGTKNWELRRVPLIPDSRALFQRMRSERLNESLDTKVFRVRECQKALNRGCKNVGAERITHHDLRQLFATRWIESGVDIPTVSRWL